MLERWAVRVRDGKPAIDCKNEFELDESVSTILALGAKADQLHLQLHGEINDTWLSSTRDHYPLALPSATHAIRGSHRVKVTEVSILIRQSSSSPVPDERDFHRALVGLHVAITARHGHP